ncbi:hypothetical protein [Umezawaea beigongshangensis]|uniref:hypothetical protein n=1 Tax=Umezawaea beigongshangensis TaxID=2780383 RepID=UPI0018F157A1|nr:hypothetical protein [Umezawaea beigongshangensis]
MSDSQALADFKNKLAGIAGEHSARMELASRKLEQIQKETAENHQKFADKQQRLHERLKEIGAARARGGAGQKQRELSFGIEDEAAPDEFAADIAALRAGRQERASATEEGSYLQAANTTSPPPDRWSRPAPQPEPAADRWGRPAPQPEPPVAVPPPPPPPPRARPAARRPAPADDDEDFGGQSWLS